MTTPGFTRRTFLATGAAAIAAPRHGRADSPFPPLLAAETEAQIAPDSYPATKLWTFNGSMPGEVLRLPQGGRLRRRVINDLPQPTTVHWHGIRIDNAMDGVPGVTQAPIAPGAGFDYDFVVPDAGTYWYHSHAQSVEQVERGLHGALIVEEPQAPDVDAEHVLVLDDLRVGEDAQVFAPFDLPHDRSHAGRLGNVVLTNGQMDLAHNVQQHQRLRLRLINVANARIFQLGLQGLEGWVVALDGMPLSEPQPVPATFLMAPAQRVDLIADVTAAPGEPAHLVHVERDEGYVQVDFPVTGAVASVSRPAPTALPPNPEFPMDLGNAHQVDLKMEGGAMGGMQEAVWRGETRGMRALAQANVFWAFNGMVGRTEDPLVTAARGDTVRIRMVNDTSFPHAMHLHGMHFSEVRADGSLGPLRDTLLMQRGETREIAFAAHNPGKWLFHCHMLSHHDAGMGTWVHVTA